jgi:hypothetical protein
LLRNQFIRFFFQFAAQQSAIASAAAAASANAADQAIKCQEMMKKDGHSSGHRFSLSQFFKSTSS